ncbi:hypothetical protein MNEG_11185 [Monoraphidium neglectum]|uniref:Uncharacterized protein n=1 Tax=Monoraphidium neglectum TaxID=145388 RepID=A0A0D2M6C3_9CHLO|nr:hypothetical protein MNEG_11185 [Monoraphidium neglectum]KIY96776.1 hypothetical protein MNEG_11185 [Monoraphidium neglectum]|eukprot:XP_013895796.1 hypothetical protein MNEG_11185 [Monoraphidium neglectum]
MALPPRLGGGERSWGPCRDSALLWTYLERASPEDGNWLTQPDAGVVLLAEGLDATAQTAQANGWPGCMAAAGPEGLVWAPPPPLHTLCRERGGGAARGGCGARPLPLRAVEHAEVLSIRLVRLLGAWQGEEGEAALQHGALQLKSSHRFPVDVAKALLSAGALVTLRRLRGGPAAAGAASPPLQLRLLYPLSVSLLQHDCIVPRGLYLRRVAQPLGIGAQVKMLWKNDNALAYTWYGGVVVGERQRAEGDPWAGAGSPWRRWEVTWHGFEDNAVAEEERFVHGWELVEEGCWAWDKQEGQPQRPRAAAGAAAAEHSDDDLGARRQGQRR